MNALLIVALVAMLVGLAMTFSGVALYESNVRFSKKSPWWVWTLIIVGGVLAVFGALTTIIVMGRDSNPNDIPGVTTQ